MWPYSAWRMAGINGIALRTAYRAIAYMRVSSISIAWRNSAHQHGAGSGGSGISGGVKDICRQIQRK